MKKNSCDRCPCCSRHCPVKDLHCKRGRAYFEKLNTKKDGAKEKPGKEICAKKSKKAKWKDRLGREGLLFRLILTGRKMKKDVKKGRFTENDLLSVLTLSERESLSVILTKLEERCVKKERKKSGSSF